MGRNKLVEDGEIIRLHSTGINDRVMAERLNVSRPYIQSRRAELGLEANSRKPLEAESMTHEKKMMYRMMLRERFGPTIHDGIEFQSANLPRHMKVRNRPL
jgi:hypothetical protein